MTLTSRPKRKRGRPRRHSDDTIRQTAERILARALNQTGNGDGHELLSLPSERELSGQLGVTRHQTRHALAFLEEGGHIRRIPGRGMVVAPAQPASAEEEQGLRCINFIHGSFLSHPGLSWLNEDYMAGYNDVLDHSDVKTRFVDYAEGMDIETLLWHRVPWAEQACLLVNRWTPELVQWLREQAIPFVIQYSMAYDVYQLPPHRAVYVNKVGGAFNATRHLIELGHRRIGYAGPVPDDTLPRAVYEGYVAALRCAGLLPRPAHLLDISEEFARFVVSPATQFLKQDEPPTAVIAANDAIAHGILLAAQDLDIDVPRDLSVMGFNDAPGAAETQPALSTVAVPRQKLARTAVQTLVDHLGDPPTEHQIQMLECELIVRQSTAEPRHP